MSDKMMKKVLVSYGFGAGWATWSDKPQKVAEYGPIIKFLERGGNPNALDDEHPLVKQMMEDLGLDSFYTGGAEGLEIETVDGPYRIDEYDGAERLTTVEDLWS